MAHCVQGTACRRWVPALTFHRRLPPMIFEVLLLLDGQGEIIQPRAPQRCCNTRPLLDSRALAPPDRYTQKCIDRHRSFIINIGKCIVVNRNLLIYMIEIHKRLYVTEGDGYTQAYIQPKLCPRLCTCGHDYQPTACSLTGSHNNYSQWLSPE